MVINNAKQYLVDWYLMSLFKDTRNTTEHRTCEKLYNKKRHSKYASGYMMINRHQFFAPTSSSS